MEPWQGSINLEYIAYGAVENPRAHDLDQYRLVGRVNQSLLDVNTTIF